MAALWQQFRERELRLRSATSQGQRTMIRGEMKRLEGEILFHQDEPWPEDLARFRPQPGEAET